MPEQRSSLITPVNFKTHMCTPTHMAMTKIHFPFCLGLPQRGQCGRTLPGLQTALSRRVLTWPCLGARAP